MPITRILYKSKRTFSKCYFSTRLRSDEFSGYLLIPSFLNKTSFSILCIAPNGAHDLFLHQWVNQYLCTTRIGRTTHIENVGKSKKITYKISDTIRFNRAYSFWIEKSIIKKSWFYYENPFSCYYPILFMAFSFQMTVFWHIHAWMHKFLCSRYLLDA